MTPFSRGPREPLPAGLLENLREEQRELRKKVTLRDDFPEAGEELYIGGIDVGFEEDGRVARAAVAVLRASDLTLVEGRIAREPATFPYIPGFLSFRELPAIHKALDLVEHPLAFLMVDGLGIAHPRGLGIASHLGVVRDLPTLGVAKSLLVGEHAPVPEEEGTSVPLLHQGEQVGLVLRSKAKCNPLILSPGHRVSLSTTEKLVKACLRGYRLPEPTRLADRLTNARYRSEGVSYASGVLGLGSEYGAPLRSHPHDSRQ